MKVKINQSINQIVYLLLRQLGLRRPWAAGTLHRWCWWWARCWGWSTPRWCWLNDAGCLRCKSPVSLPAPSIQFIKFWFDLLSRICNYLSDFHAVLGKHGLIKRHESWLAHGRCCPRFHQQFLPLLPTQYKSMTLILFKSNSNECRSSLQTISFRIIINNSLKFAQFAHFLNLPTIIWRITSEFFELHFNMQLNKQKKSIHTESITIHRSWNHVVARSTSTCQQLLTGFICLTTLSFRKTHPRTQIISVNIPFDCKVVIVVVRHGYPPSSGRDGAVSLSCSSTWRPRGPVSACRTPQHRWLPSDIRVLRSAIRQPALTKMRIIKIIIMKTKNINSELFYDMSSKILKKIITW